MQFFFDSEANFVGNQLFFDKNESRHMVKSLRKKAGDFLQVTNGKGIIFQAKILVADPNQCVAELVQILRENTPFYQLHLAVAPTKNNERYEWLLEKATEIGATQITPIICENSERRTVKTERFERIIASAMKQSLRNFLPVLNPPVAFLDFLKGDLQAHRFIAHCDDFQPKKYLWDLVDAQKAKSALVLIGPEGDFSSQEIKKALELDFQPVSLGDNRLRTETAALVACMAVMEKNTHSQ